MSEEKSSISSVNISGISGSEINIGSIVTSQTAGGDIVGGDKITLNIHKTELLPPAEAQTRRDLNILLKNVETSWIKGVLEKSIHHAVLLDLGKEVRAEAVNHPWEMVLGRPAEPDQPLPAGTNISNIFQETPLLLILGEPGSGKTITLLELARDLIARARADPTFTQPVPVIFNLSTWTNKGQPLRDWVIEELRSKYRTPKRLGRVWLEERRILPLFDGLDEVRRENRAACVEAINQFLVDYGLQGLVVCSRLKDYLELPTRLNFYGAIYIRPLSNEQIDDYLAKAGDRLAGLHDLLMKDQDLRTLAQTPLMLNIMSLTYWEIPVEELTHQPLTTIEVRRRELFNAYIQRMFNRRGKARPYDDEQTKKRLCWLAQNMQQHNQEIFFIEGLQPSWLSRRRWRWTYTLISRLISGLVCGLSAGLSAGILWQGPVGGLIVGLIIGLIVGLSIGFIDLLRFEWPRRRMEVREPFALRGIVINVIVVWLMVGLFGGLFTGLCAMLDFVVSFIVQNTQNKGFSERLQFDVAQENAIRIAALTGGLGFFLIGGLIFGLIFGVRGSRNRLTNDIQTVDALRWGRRKALIGGLIGGLMGGLIFRLLVGLFFLFLALGDGATLNGALMTGWYGTTWVGIYGSLFGGLMGVIFYGLSGEIVETKTTPNQGIRLSAKHAIVGGLIVGLSGGLVCGSSFGLMSNGLFLSLMLLGPLSGLSFGLLGALWYGGFDIIQHYILRLILIIQGHTPYSYVRFLDYAVDRIFLQKVGGGYRFIHRLLLEHFAAME